MKPTRIASNLRNDPVLKKFASTFPATKNFNTIKIEIRAKV